MLESLHAEADAHRLLTAGERPLVFSPLFTMALACGAVRPLVPSILERVRRCARLRGAAPVPLFAGGRIPAAIEAAAARASQRNLRRADLDLRLRNLTKWSVVGC